MSKLIILTHLTNSDGYELAERLEQEYEIVVEAALPHMIILMTTVADTSDTLEELKLALITIDSSLERVSEMKNIPYKHISEEIIVAESPRAIYLEDKEWLEIDLAKGCTVANNMMLYPPGIPIVCIGEVLTQDKINRIIELKDKIQGIKQDSNYIYINVRKIK